LFCRAALGEFRLKKESTATDSRNLSGSKAAKEWQESGKRVAREWQA
ncbi:MAG: hypothetical protein ACJARU_002284, partial [Congregibacter sp.]